MVGRDKTKAVWLVLAKLRIQVLDLAKKRGSGSLRTLRTPKLSTFVLEFGVGR